MISGFSLLPEALAPDLQADLVNQVFKTCQDHAPFSHYLTPGGARMSVAMSGMGERAWVSSPAGYQYLERQPSSGAPWPPIPDSLINLWRTVTARADAPDSLLVNWYGEGARMGLHQDRDEQDLTAPVVSVSLGDAARFRLGGLSRKDPTRSFRLASGDVMVLGGEARLAFHGVDRIVFGSSRLVPGGGRLNLTLRKAA